MLSSGLHNTCAEHISVVIKNTLSIITRCKYIITNIWSCTLKDAILTKWGTTIILAKYIIILLITKDIIIGITTLIEKTIVITLIKVICVTQE